MEKCSESAIEEKKGFLGIQRWLGKAVLMAIATIWLSSHVYPHIATNFNFWEGVPIENWGTKSDYGQVGVTTAMILGGWNLNTIFDFFKNVFKLNAK